MCLNAHLKICICSIIAHMAAGLISHQWSLASSQAEREATFSSSIGQHGTIISTVLQSADKSSLSDDSSKTDIGCSDSAELAFSPTSVSTSMKFVKTLVWRGKVALRGKRSFTARAYVSGLAGSISKV